MNDTDSTPSDSNRTPDQPTEERGSELGGAPGSGLPWFVVDYGQRRKMAGPYRLQETAQAVGDFMSGLRMFEGFSLEAAQYVDDGNQWMCDPNNQMSERAPRK